VFLKILRRLPAALITIVLLPVIAADYFRPSTGRDYGVGLARKLLMLLKMVRNNLQIESASNFITHVLMAARILAVPKSTPGVLVECGCFKGGSTANLSLLAAATGRQLHVFDSFEGLPAADDVDAGHVVLGERNIYSYETGAYSGSLDEVRGNVRRYGALDACVFHPGYFEDSMPGFDLPVVFAYLDVDLVKSAEPCLRTVWPLLQPDAYLFTDEAHHLEMAQLFYDRQWWEQEVGVAPPGLVGAGNGIGLFLRPGGFVSGLGYTAKIDRDRLNALRG
jgi:O-methyltransferase